MLRNFSLGHFCKRSARLPEGFLLGLLSLGCGGSGAADDDSESADSDAAAGQAGAEPAAKTRFSCTSGTEPAELVPIEAGEFSMGCNDEVDDECDEDEKPMHVVSLAAFEIDRTEVTQGQYSACVLDGACSAPTCEWDCERAEYPAGCVDWASAQAYCAWAGKRLPSEAEWEKAARGSESSKYPWGNGEPTCTLANFAECGGEAWAVGSLPDGASPYGVLDLAGNMVELVADHYDAEYYESSPEDDPRGPESGERYGGRGGGFRSGAEWLRASKRDWYDPLDAAASLGFRCAR
jgi:formylglycine-generating enzyme required for sulfatase activity